MINYKHGIQFDGIDIHIPRELAEGGDDEAIKEYIRDSVKSHVHCQRLADSLLGEEGMQPTIQTIANSRQDWVNARADIEALTRVARMPELKTEMSKIKTKMKEST